MFIVFEGIDGCGKDTQLKLAAQWFHSSQSPVSLVSVEAEPTRESEAGRELHRLLKSEEGEPGIDSLDQEAILKLYVADRLAHSAKLRTLSEQGMILGSRYDLSTYAYQSLHLTNDERQTFFENTHAQHRYQDKDGCLIPDLTLYLSLPEEVAMARVEKRGGVSGYEKLQVLKKVKQNYQAAIEYLRKKDGRQIVIVDASKSVDDLFCELKEAIAKSMNRVVTIDS